jgi:hypothetical protein
MEIVLRNAVMHSDRLETLGLNRGLLGELGVF